MVEAISDQAAFDLRALIDEALENPQFPEPTGSGWSMGKAAPKGGTKNPDGTERKDFCTMWPEARPILAAIAAGASGAGAFFPPLAGAGPVLLALIATGEAVYSKTCGTK